MLKRIVLGAAIAGLLATGSTIAAAQRESETRNEQQAQKNAKPGQQQEIDFKRKYEVGQKFTLTGKATMSISKHPKTTSPASSGSEKRTEKSAGNTNKQRRSAIKEQKSVFITGDLEVVKVDDKGHPTEVKLTVERFKVSGMPAGNQPRQNKAAQNDKMLSKGSVLIAKAGPDGAQYSLQNGEATINGDIAKALNVILPVCDKNKHQQSLSDAYRGQQNRRPGERWDVDEDELPKSHKKTGLAYTQATFVGKKKLHGVDCAVVVFRCSATPFKKKANTSDTATTKSAENQNAEQAAATTQPDKRKLKAVGASAYVFLPLKKELPPLRTGGTIAYLVHKPANSNAKASSADAAKTPKRGTIVQYSFVRDLKPANATSDAKE